MVERAEAEVRFNRLMASKHGKELAARDRLTDELKESRETANLQLNATRSALKKREESKSRMLLELDEAK